MRDFLPDCPEGQKHWSGTDPSEDGPTEDEIEEAENEAAARGEDRYQEGLED